MHFPVPEKLRTNNSRLWKVIQRHTISSAIGSRARLSILCKFYLNNNSSLRQVRADSKKSLAMWATEKTFARLVLYFNRWLFFFLFWGKAYFFNSSNGLKHNSPIWFPANVHSAFEVLLHEARKPLMLTKMLSF